MTILQRYIFFKYLSFLIGLIFLFIGLFVMIKFTEQINLFIEISDHTPLKDYIYFFLYEIPFTLTYLFPMASIFSLVYTLGKLNQDNELIVTYTAGRSIWFNVLPIFIFNLFICTTMFLNEDNFFYNSHQKHMALFRKFQNRDFFRQDNRSNLVQFGKDNKIYIANYYKVKEKVFDYVNLVYLNEDNRFDKLITTKRMEHEEGTSWKLGKHVIKEIEEDKVAFINKEEKVLNLGDSPNNFLRIIHAPKDLSAKESREIAEKLEIIGGNSNRWWTEYYSKIAFFFVAIVMFFLGVPLSTFSKNSVLVLSFTYIIVLSFIYFLLLYLGSSLGQIKVLPPILAGWLGNIIFIIVSLIIYRRVKI